MSKGAQHTLAHSKSLKDKNTYVEAMYTTYKGLVLDEEEALSFKGQWREEVFQSSSLEKSPRDFSSFQHPSSPTCASRNPVVNDKALDVEIGSGNGEHFAYLAENSPDRLYLAIELKYKPIIQTARQLKFRQLHNARVIRYNACLVDQIFSADEINNVYIYFPDPWPKKRHHKHRLINEKFLERLYSVQKKNCFVEIKTDDKAYFTEMQELFNTSSYQLIKCDENMHRQKNKISFMTFFERIFVQKNQPVYYARYLC